MSFDGRDHNHRIRPPRISNVTWDKQGVDDTKANLREVLEQSTLMAAAERIDFVRKIGKYTLRSQMCGCVLKKVLGECATGADLLEKIALVKRISVKEDRVEFAQSWQYLLPQTMFHSNVLPGVRGSPLLESARRCRRCIQ